MKKLSIKLFLLMLLIFAVLWLISFAKCEFLTLIYGESFENIVIEGSDFGDKFKVIHYSGEYAEVYYNGQTSDLVTFRKMSGEWIVSSRRIVKTTDDSGARLFVWPYFWHYIVTN